MISLSHKLVNIYKREILGAGALGVGSMSGESGWFPGEEAPGQASASRSVSSALSAAADRESHCFSCWAVTERNCSVLSLCYQKLSVKKKKNQHRGGDCVLRAHLSCCTRICDPGPPICP